MELEAMHKKVIAAAKANPPSTEVPYAFEKRIMANLRALKVDAWAFWEKALWKSAMACAALVAILSVADFQTPQPAEDLSAVIQNTVYAAFQDGVADSL